MITIHDFLSRMYVRMYNIIVNHASSLEPRLLLEYRLTFHLFQIKLFFKKVSHSLAKINADMKDTNKLKINCTI